MASNRLEIVPGTTATFTIDLVDRDGAPLPSSRLEIASAKAFIRLDPGGVDVLLINSVPIDVLASTAKLTLSVAETNTLIVGTPYFWQLEVTFETGEIDIAIDWSPIDVTLGGAAAPTPPTFDNTVKVDHDFPLADDLRYMTPGGSPIADAQVRVYYKSDYAAGLLDKPIGRTTTNAYGRWAQAILVPPGFNYVVRMEKPTEFGPDIKEIVGV